MLLAGADGRLLAGAGAAAPTPAADGLLLLAGAGAGAGVGAGADGGREGGPAEGGRVVEDAGRDGDGAS